MRCEGHARHLHSKSHSPYSLKTRCAKEFVWSGRYASFYLRATWKAHHHSLKCKSLLWRSLLWKSFLKSTPPIAMTIITIKSLLWKAHHPPRLHVWPQLDLCDNVSHMMHGIMFHTMCDSASHMTYGIMSHAIHNDVSGATNDIVSHVMCASASHMTHDMISCLMQYMIMFLT